MDSADRSQAIEELQIREAMSAHRAASLIEDQSIGPDGRVWCNDCDAEIDAARLAIVPHAVCCIGCQEARERRERRG